MNNWQTKLGSFLFRHRSFTPLPVILLIFLIFTPGELNEISKILLTFTGIITAISGELIRILAVGYSFEGTSGRESYLKAEKLNVTGIYSLVRNPLYIGNFLMFNGILIIFANVYASLIMAAFLFIQYYFIILSEEDFLEKKYKDKYHAYCGSVNRIIPVLKNFQPPENRFNLKKVIFKENDSIFNMMVMALAIIFYRNYYYLKSIRFSFYVILLVILIFSYIFVKILKKKADQS